VRFEPEAVRTLCRYGWPLNVRELEQCLASSVVLARDSAIGVEQLSISRSVNPRLRGERRDNLPQKRGVEAGPYFDGQSRLRHGS
jgi:DNA-binding NtrC family response regulator